jgi:hypothetical protein
LLTFSTAYPVHISQSRPNLQAIQLHLRERGINPVRPVIAGFGRDEITMGGSKGRRAGASPSRPPTWPCTLLFFGIIGAAREPALADIDLDLIKRLGPCGVY